MTWIDTQHRGPVSADAWQADSNARLGGRVQIFNASRPAGLDGWTMSVERYEVLRNHVLASIDAEPYTETGVALGEVIQSAKERYGQHSVFLHAKVRNLAIYVALDLQARCEIETIICGNSAHLRRVALQADPEFSLGVSDSSGASSATSRNFRVAPDVVEPGAWRA